MPQPFIVSGTSLIVDREGTWRRVTWKDGEVTGDISGSGYWGPRAEVTCRVYWGSHGCMLERGHDGDHTCHCAFDEEGREMPNMNTPGGEGNGNVGNAPYYGPETRFYGEDAP